MSSEVHVWWAALCAIAVLNLAAWAGTAHALARRRARLPDEVFRRRRWLLLLAGVYVAGCAWRSVLPVYDVPRQVMVDSWWSSVIVGRSVATLAELSFVAQWALLLREMGRGIGSSFAMRVSAALLPMIALAETFSWHAVLTTSNLGHAIEEALWAAAALLACLSLLAVWPRCERSLRPLLAGCLAAGLGYVAYMVLVDVPRYVARWLADEAAGRAYLGLWQGAVDASQRWVVSHRWADWQGEVVWMTLYFSVAVWLSLALVHAPPLRRASRPGLAASSPVEAGAP